MASLADVVSYVDCPRCRTPHVEPVVDGAKLKALREAKGMQSAHMARELGVSATHLSDMEANRRTWQVWRAEKFLAILEGCFSKPLDTGG